MSSLEEAVYVWFESCIERDVLSEALAELGFTKSGAGERVPDNASLIEMKVRSRATPKRKAPAKQYVEVRVPAYIAAAHLGVCATS